MGDADHESALSSLYARKRPEFVPHERCLWSAKTIRIFLTNVQGESSGFPKPCCRQFTTGGFQHPLAASRCGCFHSNPSVDQTYGGFTPKRNEYFHGLRDRKGLFSSLPAPAAAASFPLGLAAGRPGKIQRMTGSPGA